KLPKTAVVSTGNELVEITENPFPYQIRRFNIHTLYGALSEEGIVPNEFHLADNKEAMREKLPPILRDHNTVLLSGGISKGKYDFIPEILEELGVTKIFYQVSQRPGKPFWFGIQKETGTIVFCFPGNPVSSFVNYLVYFKDWLKSSMALPITKIHVILAEDIGHRGDLTLFLRVKITNHEGKMLASPVQEN